MSRVNASGFILFFPLIYSLFLLNWPYNTKHVVTETTDLSTHSIMLLNGLWTKDAVCFLIHHMHEFRECREFVLEDMICCDVLWHSYSPDLRAMEHHWDEVKWHIHSTIVLSEILKEHPDTIQSEGKKDPFETSPAPCWIHGSGCLVATKGSHLVLRTWSYRNGYWEVTTHSTF